MIKDINIVQKIRVEVDETKFNDEFINAFKQYFYDFDDIEEHLMHLAQLYARGIVNGYSDDFAEGYGNLSNMGIKFTLIDCYEEIND